MLRQLFFDIVKLVRSWWNVDRVRVSPGPAYVKAVRVGPAETAGSVLDLRYGASGVTPVILLSTAVASISGSVTDDKGPAAGVRTSPIALDGWRSIQLDPITG